LSADTRTPGRHRAGQRRVAAPEGTARPATAASPGKDRLLEIDLLRLTAAVAILMYHYTFFGHAAGYLSVSYPALSSVTRYGYLAVDLFFTISGFVVLLSAWGRRPHEFVISRMVRVYPAFWVGVTVTAVVTVILGHGMFKVTPLQYLANLTLANSLPNIANIDVVYWTLWAEMRFYLVLFVLTCIGISRSRVIKLLWLWLAATAVIEAGVLPAGLASLADLLVQSQWSHYLIAGMALCTIYRTGFSWTLGAILALAYGNALYRAIGFAHLVSARLHQTLYLPVSLTIITLIFVVMTLIAFRLTRRFGRPWFASAGTLTYPLYLLHCYIGLMLFHLLDRYVNRWVLLAGILLLMGGAAYLVHRLVEVPLGPPLKRALTRLAANTGQWRASRRLAPSQAPPS
jgi:peptidoglycan/LPS O-acetylase OafA/YrhL